MATLVISINVTKNHSMPTLEERSPDAEIVRHAVILYSLRIMHVHVTTYDLVRLVYRVKLEHL